MSLEYHQEEMPWPEVLRTARSLWLQRPAQRDSGTRQESVQSPPISRSDREQEVCAGPQRRAPE